MGSRVGGAALPGCKLGHEPRTGVGQNDLGSIAAEHEPHRSAIAQPVCYRHIHVDPVEGVEPTVLSAQTLSDHGNLGLAAIRSPEGDLERPIADGPGRDPVEVASMTIRKWAVRLPGIKGLILILIRLLNIFKYILTCVRYGLLK